MIIKHQSADRKGRLREIYLKQLAEGIEFNGNHYQIDDDSMTAMMLNSTRDGVTWRAMDNAMIELSKAELSELIKAALSYRDRLLKDYWSQLDG